VHPDESTDSPCWICLCKSWLSVENTWKYMF
jgi:hypothetical protein